MPRRRAPRSAARDHYRHRQAHDYDLAAFNGAAFRYSDFNDTYVGRFPFIPAIRRHAFAEAERQRTELITAIVIAYEVNCRLVDARHDARLDPPVMSSAVAPPQAHRLGPGQLTQAVNPAVNDHIPMAQTRADASD